MCGIWIYLAKQPISAEKRALLMKAFEKINHRGPNANRVLTFEDRVLFGFTRLAIVDPSENGMGPFLYKETSCVANAEIYNYEALETELKANHQDTFKSFCDTEVILPMFDYLSKDMDKLCRRLDGEYAFVIYDKETRKLHFATDEISMRPMFVATTEEGDVVISSELSAIRDLKITQVKRLGAGQWGEFNIDSTNEVFNFRTFNTLERSQYLPLSYEDSAAKLRELFIQNIKDKLHMGTREDGFYLSGGLDSSLTAGVAARLRSPRKLNTFVVGFSTDATDVVFARRVAEHIGSNHHEIIVSEQDGLNAIADIVKLLGTFDQTTVRASTPLYLATKWIKQKYPDTYIMYNGELADELLGGYLYFRNAPSAAAHREESIRRLLAVHNYDGLRCDRVCASFSIEARFPFFSKTLLDFVMSSDPKYFNPSDNNGIEKKILRDAFKGLGYIPEEVLNRTKNALSDATSVKSSWKEKLKEMTEKSVSDEEFATREKWTHTTPDTKEDYYYRQLFEKEYPQPCDLTIPYKWLPLWCGDVKDSSASVLQVFNEDTAEPHKTQS